MKFPVVRNIILACLVIVWGVVIARYVAARAGLFDMVPRRITLNRMTLWIVDEEGRPLVRTSDEPVPVGWRKVLNGPEDPAHVTFSTLKGTPGRFAAVRLQQPPNSYGILELGPNFLAPPFATFLSNQVRLTGPIILISILLCVGFVLFFFRRIRLTAEGVFASLKAGDLKARFPVKRLDELGRFATQFNRMADEIERLVERLREAEHSRTLLLRELAHDVRTPLTSLRYLLETVSDRADKLPPASVKEKLRLAVSEMSYFQRLIEDLFLLAEVNEPHYRPEGTPVALLDVVTGELERAVDLALRDGKTIEPKLRCEIPGRPTVYAEPYLVRRLFQNAFDNAAAHARGALEVIVRETESFAVEITVRDDGPGFSAESLARFGERRTSRFIDSAQGERASLGLGSLIMRTVATNYGGSVTPANWTRPDGTVGGAELRILFPLTAETAGKAA